jgi:hypothetical protein
MKVRSPRLLATAASVLVASGVGAALADASSNDDHAKRAGVVHMEGGMYLDDLAERLGVERSKLDAALEAGALDEVEWARAAGFLTDAQAKALKERIENGARAHGLSHFRFAPGFSGEGLSLDGFLAAAQYLDLSATRLRNALETKTLAEIAGDAGKSVDALKQALVNATRESLDDARTRGPLTQKQEDALLERFEASVDDLVNGRSPEVTALAKRLGIEPAKIQDALEAGAIARVDQALEDGLLSKAQADRLKEKIEAGRAFGHGLPGLGFGPGPFGFRSGPLGFGFGLGHLEFGFDGPGLRHRGGSDRPFGGAFGEPTVGAMPRPFF